MSDEGFDPTPYPVEAPSASEELRLQDLAADGPTISLETGPPSPLGRAPAYDFASRRFLPGVAGGPLMTRGIETLATWIEKCILTRRGASPAVDPGFGCVVTIADLLEEGGPADAAALAEWVASLERGLIVNPRITGIDDVVIRTDPDDDAAFISMHVSTDDDLDDFNFDQRVEM